MQKTKLFKTMTILFVLAAISVATVSAHGFRFGGSSYSKPEGMNLSSYNLNDGTYTGTADGFRPDLEVEITVKNGKLTDVEVTDHNEIGRQYYQKPINLIPESIVEEQATEVDSVSGATATSKAIMAAVEEAVKKAEK